MKNQWFEEYKSKIYANEKNLKEMYEWMSKKFGIKELNEEEIQKNYFIRYKIFEQNCRNITKNNALKIKVFALNFDDIKEYFDDDGDHILLVEENNFIIECDSNVLYKEIKIERGFNSYDYENNTAKLLEYIILKFDLNK